MLLSSDDGGADWKEAAARVPGAALDQVQLLDAQHGWAAGEIQVPLARDPFFLVTSDAGRYLEEKTLSDDGGPGDVQRFWFDSPDHGELIVDAGRSAEGGRYQMYESRTGGENWNILSKTAQLPRLRRAPAVDEVNYRIGTDSESKTYVIERRDGEKWMRVSSFLVQVANCGAPPPPPLLRQPPNRLQMTSNSATAGDLEVFRNLFVSIAEEMGAVLRRTAFSANIKERRDYSCAVYDAARPDHRDGRSHAGASWRDAALSPARTRRLSARAGRRRNRQRSVSGRHASSGYHRRVSGLSAAAKSRSSTLRTARTMPMSVE